MNWLITSACYNILVLLFYGLDKLLAKLRARRIPEKLLLALAVSAGATGALCGMVVFHHKISKPKFRYTVSILFILQVGFFMWLQATGKIIL